MVLLWVGYFTVFLVLEFLLRWFAAIVQKRHTRWFVFLFVHWYEALGCFVAFRAFRLFRVVVLVRHLHKQGVRILPKKWLESIAFYQKMLLSALSDRILLAAIDDLRPKIGAQSIHQQFFEQNLPKHKDAIVGYIAKSVQEVLPKVLQDVQTQSLPILQKSVRTAVEQSLKDNDELRRYIKRIPMVGGMMESKIVELGGQIGENITQAVQQNLLSTPQIYAITDTVGAAIIQHINQDSKLLSQMSADIVQDMLTVFKAQLKAQQYEHDQKLHLQDF